MAVPTDAAAEPVALFQGYDRVLGDGRSMALTGTSHSSGASISSRYQVCEGVQEVMKEMSISQSLSVGFFGIVNVSQKLEFLQRQRLTSHSVSIVVSSQRIEHLETVTNAALRDGVAVPSDELELAEFLQVYGDSYVSSRTTGGEYFGVYSFYSETSEEQEELIASMEVGGILKAFVGDVGLQTKISEFRHSQNMRVTFDQTMTGVMNPSFPDADAVLDFALVFPSLELTAPQLIGVETTSYQRVPGIATRFSTIARNVDMLTRADLAAQLTRAQELRARIAPILRVYEFYLGRDRVREVDAKLVQVESEVEADIEATLALVKAFEEHPTRLLEAQQVPQFVSLRHGMPRLDFHSLSSTEYTFWSTLAPGPPAGRVHMDTMDGRNIEECLQSRTHIVALEVLTAAMPDQGNRMGRHDGLLVVVNNGKRTWNVVMGGRRNSRPLAVAQLRVPSGHFVRSVRMMLAPSTRRLEHLRMELTDGSALSNSGTPVDGVSEFLETTPSGYFLLGFRGSQVGDLATFANRTLLSLQMVYVQLRPAVWSS